MPVQWETVTRRGISHRLVLTRQVWYRLISTSHEGWVVSDGNSTNNLIRRSAPPTTALRLLENRIDRKTLIWMWMPYPICQSLVRVAYGLLRTRFPKENSPMFHSEDWMSAAHCTAIVAAPSCLIFGRNGVYNVTDSDDRENADIFSHIIHD